MRRRLPLQALRNEHLSRVRNRKYIAFSKLDNKRSWMHWKFAKLSIINLSLAIFYYSNSMNNSDLHQSVTSRNSEENISCGPKQQRSAKWRTTLFWASSCRKPLEKMPSRHGMIAFESWLIVRRRDSVIENGEKEIKSGYWLCLQAERTGQTNSRCHTHVIPAAIKTNATEVDSGPLFIFKTLPFSSRWCVCVFIFVVISNFYHNLRSIICWDWVSVECGAFNKSYCGVNISVHESETERDRETWLIPPFYLIFHRAS